MGTPEGTGDPLTQAYTLVLASVGKAISRIAKASWADRNTSPRKDYPPRLEVSSCELTVQSAGCFIIGKSGLRFLPKAA